MFRLLKIKATLRGIEPVVWRIINVSDDVTFYRLQKNLQEYFGWPVSKFSVFTTRGVKISQKHGTTFQLEGLNSVMTRLFTFNFMDGDHIELRQNLMDDWVFDLNVESVIETNSQGILSCAEYCGTTPPIHHSGPNEFYIFENESHTPKLLRTLCEIK